MVAAIRPVMTKIFAEQGITYLGALYTYAGLSTASIKHHYRTPDDMRGQKIRSAGMWNMKYFKIWGATPTMILPAEVYSSLQKGIIDGVSGILELIGTLKYYEVAPYITEFPDTEVTLLTYGMNMKKFNSMEKQYQDVILQVSREAELYSFNSGRKYEAQIRKEIVTKAKYLMLTPEEVRPFLEAVQPVKKEMREYCGPLGNELMDVLEKMRK
jgi:TRAP-type C4-dicarboxylate transport system substrate-binding protein